MTTEFQLPPPSSAAGGPAPALAGDLGAVVDLREVLDLAAAAILVLSDDQRLIYFNEAAARLFGYKPDEVLGRPLDVLIPGRFIQSHQAHVRHFAAGPEHSRYMADRQPLVGRHKDGHEIPLEISISRQSRAGVTTLAAVVHDLTERRQALQLLEQRVEERTRELERRRQVAEGLHEVLVILNSNRPLTDILAYILDRAIDVLAADAGAILQRAPGGQSLAVVEARTLPNADRFAALLAPCCADPVGRQPLFIPDLAGWPDDLPGGWGHAGVLAVPLFIHDEPYGVQALCFLAARAVPAEALDLAAMFGQQAALAIENGRLQAQVQAAAAQEERQKLARDLHDSVSQTIYGIALSIRTARQLLDRDAAQAAQPLEYGMTLAEAALAEMRALIFELRPEALEQEGLVGAIGKHVAALQARHGLAVSLDLGDEPRVSMAVKEALYRVTQEALQNVLRHAGASRVVVRLVADRRGLLWEVQDDGQGFDASQPFPGHLGLRSMRERVEQVGGVWETVSMPGRGVRLRAHIPV
jgi:PAS domain S-box-containing protein